MLPVDKATLPRPAPHAHRHPTSHVPSPPPTCLPAHHAQLRGLGARRARRRERRSDAGAQRQRPPGVQPGGLCAAASHGGAAAGRCGAWPARLVGGGLVTIVPYTTRAPARPTRARGAPRNGMSHVRFQSFYLMCNLCSTVWSLGSCSSCCILDLAARSCARSAREREHGFK